MQMGLYAGHTNLTGRRLGDRLAEGLIASKGKGETSSTRAC